MTRVLELPTGNAKVPAVVIVHEWWGVNEQMEATARKYAAEGFLAVVPDLYHGKRAANADEAAAMMNGLDFAAAVQELAATVEELRAHPRCTGQVVLTGYCMGGALTFKAAVEIRGLACVVPYYGLPGDLDWTQIDAPIQAHFAEHDDWATVAGARQIKEAVTAPMELHVYDAQHAFCNERRPEVYDAKAAAIAWDRTLAFIRQHTTA